MTRADSVHSTPRKTASKIQRKKRAKPVESEEQRNLRHDKAFRDLEAPMHDLYCMAEIAAQAAEGVEEHQIEITHFAIYRLCEMVRDFRAKYRADLHAGLDRGKTAEAVTGPQPVCAIEKLSWICYRVPRLPGIEPAGPKPAGSSLARGYGLA
jgi:hypothetical protein